MKDPNKIIADNLNLLFYTTDNEAVVRPMRNEQKEIVGFKITDRSCHDLRNGELSIHVQSENILIKNNDITVYDGSSVEDANNVLTGIYN